MYGTQFLHQAVENVSKRPGDLFEFTCHYMFNQMSAKQGIEKHGKVTINALLPEFAQLEGLDTFMGMHAKDLSKT